MCQLHQVLLIFTTVICIHSSTLWLVIMVLYFFLQSCGYVHPLFSPNYCFLYYVQAVFIVKIFSFSLNFGIYLIWVCQSRLAIQAIGLLESGIYCSWLFWISVSLEELAISLIWAFFLYMTVWCFFFSPCHFYCALFVLYMQSFSYIMPQGFSFLFGILCASCVCMDMPYQNWEVFSNVIFFFKVNVGGSYHLLKLYQTLCILFLVLHSFF